jgi:hypothetical protein
LADRSHAPHRTPHKISPRVVALILRGEGVPSRVGPRQADGLAATAAS